MTSTQKKEESHNVLWVRHCVSCANEASTRERRYKIEPLCSNKGIFHCFVSGENIAKNIIKIYETEGKKIPPIRFYCSFLPRAMETAKIISESFLKRREYFTDIGTEIKRVCHTSEFWEKFEPSIEGGSQGTTTLLRSDTHAKFLNAVLSNVGLPIKEDSHFDLKDCCSLNQEKRCMLDPEEGYESFLENILFNPSSNLRKDERTSRSSSSTLNIIVSHGGYMESNVLENASNGEELKKKVKRLLPFGNVDALLVKYTRWSFEDESKKNGNDLSTVLYFIKSPPPSKILASHKNKISQNYPQLKHLSESQFGKCLYKYDDIQNYINV